MRGKIFFVLRIRASSRSLPLTWNLSNYDVWLHFKPLVSDQRIEGIYSGRKSVLSVILFSPLERALWIIAGLSAAGAFARQQLRATGVSRTNADYEEPIVKINKNDNRGKNLCVVQPFSFLRSKLIFRKNIKTHLANFFFSRSQRVRQRAFQCKTGSGGGVPTTLHRPLILSERVIIAIRSGRAIKAEGVCCTYLPALH